MSELYTCIKIDYVYYIYFMYITIQLNLYILYVTCYHIFSFVMTMYLEISV